MTRSNNVTLVTLAVVCVTTGAAVLVSAGRSGGAHSDSGHSHGSEAGSHDGEAAAAAGHGTDESHAHGTQGPPPLPRPPDTAEPGHAADGHAHGTAPLPVEPAGDAAPVGASNAERMPAGSKPPPPVGGAHGGHAHGKNPPTPPKVAPKGHSHGESGHGH